MDPILKTVLSVAVFLFSFVWYFKNYANVMKWINSKLGIETTKNKVGNTDAKA